MLEVRIAIVGTELRSVDHRGGGLELVLLRWATALSECHDVVIVSHGRREQGPFETVDVDGAASLRDALLRIGPDVVSLHNRPQWSAMCPPGVAVRVTFHNYPAAWKYRPRMLPATPRYSAVSAALAAAVARRLPVGNNAAVTYPPIAAEFFSGPVWRPGGGVLFPHRLMRKKGVLDLLEIAGLPELRSVEFALADLISPWRRATSEHRVLRAAVAAVPNARLFSPATSAADLTVVYAAAGVVACPAIEPEGLGLVPLEAQASGAPVVTTDLGGLKEATFAPNACVPPHDRRAFAEALLDALHRRSASPAARRGVLERHEPSVAGQAYERWLTAGV